MDRLNIFYCVGERLGPGLKSLARRSALVVVLMLLAPGAALSHHISMSFSNWEFSYDKASVVFRLPLADAVWIMDPDLVIRAEAMIQIKGPVDDALKSKVRAYLERTLPQKVAITGCSFDPGMKVSFERTSVQVEAELSCTPDYLTDLELTSHFLVDENRLHTSLATLNFPDRVEQCLLRYSKFSCGARTAQPAARTAPSRQARIAAWWDYLALFLVLLFLADSTRTVVISLALLILGHALAPVALRMGLPVPSSAILRSVICVLPIYAGLAVFTAERGQYKSGWAWLLAGHALALMLAGAEFIRMSPFMLVGLFMVGAGSMAGNQNNDLEKSPPKRSLSTALLPLVFCFGLVHGFVLLRYRSQSGILELVHAGPLLLIIPAALGLAFLARRFNARFQAREWVALGMVAAGLLVFALRNVNLPFSYFEYENARELLTNLVQSREISASFLVLVAAMAVVMGGLHALTPGHGKTIVAAYLIGTKGRINDAIILGFIVTLTHTFSVIVLALLALLASRYILPDQLVPWLSGASGLLILALGIYLFHLRLTNYMRYGTVAPAPEQGHEHDHHHEHDHEHSHDHDHQHSDTISHTHDGVTHAHVLPSAGVTLGSLVALGITGGIVPCPDALAVLLIAVSLNRILFGLGVIIAFSAGLAAVLIAIGIVMVKARPLVDRFAGRGRFTMLWLPLLSAVFITVLGAAMIWKAWPG